LRLPADLQRGPFGPRGPEGPNLEVLRQPSPTYFWPHRGPPAAAKKKRDPHGRWAVAVQVMRAKQEVLGHPSFKDALKWDPLPAAEGGSMAPVKDKDIITGLKVADATVSGFLCELTVWNTLGWQSLGPFEGGFLNRRCTLDSLASKLRLCSVPPLTFLAVRP
jgi:hypothetical protein